MAKPTHGSSLSGGKSEDPSVLLGKLHLEDDEMDNLIWEKEVDDPLEKPKWLALAKVLTRKSFSQGALIAHMKSAWNPSRDVTWRRINSNLFSVQFNCLAWDFSGSGLIAEYDGFSNPEEFKLDKIEAWCQIHKLPDGVLKNERVVENLAKRIGEVLEVQIVLPSGFIGEFIRVRGKLDVITQKTHPVHRFHQVRETEFYQVKFEKLPTFCYVCGKLGHWHQECGSGEHDENKMEWGPFIMASKRGRGGGRGAGTFNETGRVAEVKGGMQETTTRGRI